MAEGKTGITHAQVFGVVVVIVWAVTWYWIQDQMTRVRATEQLGLEQKATVKVVDQTRVEHESRLKSLEQQITVQEATGRALAPYSADDRTLLKSVNAMVIRQDDKLQYVVNTMEAMNIIIQTLGKDQIAVRNRLDTIEDAIKRGKR
jgi:uncharacterized coiled-coil protein SlyX